MLLQAEEVGDGSDGDVVGGAVGSVVSDRGVVGGDGNVVGCGIDDDVVVGDDGPVFCVVLVGGEGGVIGDGSDGGDVAHVFLLVLLML